jgi:hypothetical protein
MQHINEQSPESFEGSMSDEQIISRLWMSRRLKDTAIPIKNCAVLGSWYGILPYVLSRNNDIENIVAIDSEPGCVDVSKKLNPGIKHVVKDCNKLKYTGADCVVNPSINNIGQTQWYNNIPQGCLCLFQTENIANAPDTPRDLAELKQQYPLKEYLYEGTLKCKDRDGEFMRSMVIGYK